MIRNKQQKERMGKQTRKNQRQTENKTEGQMGKVVVVKNENYLSLIQIS